MDHQHNHYLPPPPPPPPQTSSDPYQQWNNNNNNNNYSTTTMNNNQFQYQQQWSGPPPPPPPPPQQYYPPPRVPQPYPTHHPQEWGGGNWSQHQNWQYPNNPNEEDWAAKARAWAAGNASTDNQHPQSQFVPAARPEGQHYFHNQFSQPVEHYPVEMGPPNGSGPVQSHYLGSGQSSYVADMHPSYAANNGNSVAPFPQHDKSSISPSDRQQEVPSSYSSIKGNDSISNYEGFNNSTYRPVLPHHVQPQPQPQPQLQHNHLLGSQPAETAADPSDQPLNFAPHFNPNMDPHAAQPNFTHSSGGPVGDHAAISSDYAWPPSSAAGAYYPPAATNISNSGPQVDHPSMFSSGPAFQPTFGVGSGITPHAMNFSGDAYGMPDRPKKASVPIWLREEIIKKKATGSAFELSKVNSESVDDDNIDNKFSERDLAERSIDSSRSTDDEDEEEVEAARNAVINQEIKRILTDVLLKVTDELFDEIATKVLNEDDLSVEVGNDTDLSNDQVLPPTQATVTPKASAKILIPTKGKIIDAGDASENSISGSAGNVLGLASYASDEEDDDEIQNSVKLQTMETSSQMQLSSDKDLRDLPVLQNGSSKEVTAEQSRDLAKLNDAGGVKESASKDLHRKDSSKSEKSVNEMPAKRIEKPVESSDAVRSENTYSHTSHDRPDKNDGYEIKKSPSLKDPTRSEKGRAEKKEDEEIRRKEERHARAENTEYYNGPNDKKKDKDRNDEKTKESESRKRQESESRKRHSPADGNDGASRTVRDKRSKHKDEKKREKSRDEKKERSRHDTISDSSRHKRHRSPSVGRRDRDSKNKSASGHANDHSDHSSDDSKRKSRPSRRHRSPSPVRHRKRQVSRSPHSKHSKRRHSPYSSLETTRGKHSRSRSRSKSPVRRRR